MLKSGGGSRRQGTTRGAPGTPASPLPAAAAATAARTTAKKEARAREAAEGQKPAPVVQQLLSAPEEERPTHSFSPEELELCKKCFSKYDINGDGSIDVFELRVAMLDCGHAASEEELVQIIKRYDTSGIGRLTYDDFLNIIWQQKLAAQREVSADIDTIDAFVAMGGNPDKTGSIVARKLIDTCKEFKLTIDIEELIAETDQDGSGFIDYEEFSLMLND